MIDFVGMLYINNSIIIECKGTRNVRRLIVICSITCTNATRTYEKEMDVLTM